MSSSTDKSSMFYSSCLKKAFLGLLRQMTRAFRGICLRNRAEQVVYLMACRDKHVETIFSALNISSVKASVVCCAVLQVLPLQLVSE